MKETTGTNYKNPLTDERQEIGTDERKYNGALVKTKIRRIYNE